ncbi:MULTISPECIES: depupylase/deamidase Dop [Kocuria]|uniref:Proteasome accessory factor PafA2 n=1 Tax=Kocuria subflava TaxID=1736139 RepID=A0A846U883_9MICC|nr:MULTISPECIES: depupylase/deamidase Dop [Kocuria]NKE09796.1 proteasome accessory factor PafA2 [Kocuria subflava]
MSVRRVMGAETEFGVLAPAKPMANATVLSTRVVTAYAALVRRELGAVGETVADFDYSSETPLQDSRGFAMERAKAHPTQLTDTAPVLTSEEIAAEALAEQGMWEDYAARIVMNTVLPNGARLYVDHSHPEYSSPEVLTPRDAVLYDLAGDAVAATVVEVLAASAEATGLEPIHLYKNNTDGKSASYGSHENYQIPRDINLDRLHEALLPFFASRQVVCGAGRVGLGTDGARPGFQISQRADFFERQVGLETTVRRPIVNTRDEPHADDSKYRRLHVIVGDANLAHHSQLLKFGITSLVLRLVEHKAAPVIPLYDPVEAIHTISHDPTLQATVPTRDGRRLTGVQVQRLFLEAAEALEGPDPDADTAEILHLWREVLDTLETNPMALADRLDWMAKYQLLLTYKDRGNLEWNAPQLAAIDLQYHDVNPAKGLYHRLAAAGRIQTLFTNDQIRAATWTPPAQTRADFRGRLVAAFPDDVVTVGWDAASVKFDGVHRGARLTMPEPTELTQEQTATWWTADTVEDLVRHMEKAHPTWVWASTTD